MVSNTFVSATWLGSILNRSCESDDEIGEFAGFNRAFCLFAMPGKGGVQRIGADGVFEAEMRSSGSQPPAGGLLDVSRVRAFCTPYHGLSVTTGQSLPKASTPPVLSMLCQTQARLRAFLTDVARPDLQRVIVGIGMQRLEAGNHTVLCRSAEYPAR